MLYEGSSYDLPRGGKPVYSVVMSLLYELDGLFAHLPDVEVPHCTSTNASIPVRVALREDFFQKDGAMHLTNPSVYTLVKH